MWKVREERTGIVESIPEENIENSFPLWFSKPLCFAEFYSASPCFLLLLDSTDVFLSSSLLDSWPHCTGKYPFQTFPGTETSDWTSQDMALLFHIFVLAPRHAFLFPWKWESVVSGRKLLPHPPSVAWLPWAMDSGLLFTVACRWPSGTEPQINAFSPFLFVCVCGGACIKVRG